MKAMKNHSTQNIVVIVYTSVAICVPVEVVYDALDDIAVHLNRDDWQAYRSRSTCFPNSCVFESRAVCTVSVCVHLKNSGVKS